MQYKILQRAEAADLEREVEDYISRAWIPQGGVQVLRFKRENQYGHTWVWIQAMYRPNPTTA